MDDETAHFVCSFQSRPDLQGVKTGALKTVVRTAANSSKADPIFRGSKHGGPPGACQRPWAFQSRPDLQGVKTGSAAHRHRGDLFQSRPDLQGVKTAYFISFLPCRRPSKADPIFRGSKQSGQEHTAYFIVLPKQTRSSGGQNVCGERNHKQSIVPFQSRPDLQGVKMSC